MTTYLIDDETHCTEVLQVLLERYCPDLQVTGIFNDPEVALTSIKNTPPDLLFLDIEMPVLNGFDLLQSCESLDFRVIFTTAYDKYAINAFKFNTIDYLLKPIDKSELITAVKKAQKNIKPNSSQMNWVQYLKNNPTPERIALPVGYELIMVEANDIQFIKTEGSYASVYLNSQKKPIVLSKSIREFEDLLNNANFFRAHNSYLINLKFIKKIIRTDGGEIIMDNGQSIPVARARKPELMALIVKM